MTDMARSRVVLAYPNGGPGVNTFYWTSGYPAGPIDGEMIDDFHAEILGLYSNIIEYMPNQVTITVSPDVDILDPTTGNITGVATDSGAAKTTTGLVSGAPSTRAQCCVANIRTDSWVNGYRLRGRHFLGPMSGSMLDTYGATAASLVADVVDGYAAMISGVGARLAVWHRPPQNDPDGGYYADVISVDVKANPGLLRSRRD